MLQQLQIQNYAIIDEINIDFSGKLNIITGETGAGKSILVGALSLILGERADSTVLLHREKKCMVEGCFSTPAAGPVREFLLARDLDIGQELIIRREIAVNGKSRAFINDTPVNLDQLRQLSALLVDLHQQFDTLTLGETDFQREVLDALAANHLKLHEYRQGYTALELARKKLKSRQAEKSAFTAQYDYHKFLSDELEEANFRENEVEELDNELKLLSNAEGIKGAISGVVDLLSDGEEPVVQQLKRAQHQLQAFTGWHAGIGPLLDRLQSAQLELADIGDELARTNDQIQYDPLRIEQISDRIATGYKLFKKHAVTDTAGLLAIREQLSAKLDAVHNLDSVIGDLEKECDQLLTSSTKIAAQLSAARGKQAEPLQQKVNRLLKQVGMPNARLKVSIHALPANGLDYSGADHIEFLFDANNSDRFEPVRKVASGGELSRLMLCIKSLVAESLDMPTLIFDEIDTGISGEAARQVGIIMKALAVSRQVISITHQPQIAGKADAHFFVYKETRDRELKTNIRLLTPDERITTIARMLSGEKPTAAALENAREMLMN
jgi:DNA repair protein RecN (Recombination protein N)